MVEKLRDLAAAAGRDPASIGIEARAEPERRTNLEQIEALRAPGRPSARRISASTRWAPASPRLTTTWPPSARLKRSSITSRTKGDRLT